MNRKQESPRRRSLNDRLEAEWANSESIQVAGITSDHPQPEQAKVVTPSVSSAEGVGEKPFPTKKATTIMPKEVFNVLQRFCMDTETPKHRVIYRFIIDGLHASGTINDEDYNRFRDMAAQLTTTYEKKQS